MHATLSTRYRTKLFKQNCKHLLIKRIQALISSQLQEFLMHQKAFARCQTVVIHYLDKH